MNIFPLQRVLRVKVLSLVWPAHVACRQLAVWAVFWLLVLFYAPIVAAVQAPVNLDNLRKVTPGPWPALHVACTLLWIWFMHEHGRLFMFMPDSSLGRLSCAAQHAQSLPLSS